MKNLITLLLVACVMFLTVGCKDKSPKGLCEKMTELASDEEKKEEGDKDKAMERCIKMGEEAKKNHTEESFEEFATCIHEASDSKGGQACFKKLKSK